MPENVKLSSHRGKVYVGVQDISKSSLATCSGSTRRSDGRSSLREPSAATTIGSASVVDWTENGNDVNAGATLSGELSVVLPPVTGAQSSSPRGPPPGLDTHDLFRHRMVSEVHKNKPPKAKSPRVSRSRGGVNGVKAAAGFRPPHNTPFLVLTHPDDFSASLRTSVTSPNTRPNMSVLIRGGGITPVLTNRPRPLYPSSLSREGSRLSKYKVSHIPTTSQYVGSANFDMPMIDLKCVESPVSNLGNLEEKGIRLVRLRKAKKKRVPSENGDKTNGQTASEAGSVYGGDTSKRSSFHEDNTLPLLPTTKSLITCVPPTSRADLVPEGTEPGVEDEDNRTAPLNGIKVDKASTVSTTNQSEAQEPLILTNREPYATTLLPDTERSSIKGNREQYLSKDDTQLKDPSKVSLVVEDSSKLGVKKGGEERLPNLFNETVGGGGAPGLLPMFMVEKVDTTPIPPTPPGEEDEERDDVFYNPDQTPPVTGRARLTKRSSSLLSVPASLISEVRPSFSAHPEDDPLDVDVVLTIPVPEADAGIGNVDDETGRTIATQTTPPETNRTSENTPYS